jgi:hypothetical protein
MHAAPDPDVFDLVRGDETANLPLGNADASRELFRGFKVLAHLNRRYFPALQKRNPN